MESTTWIIPANIEYYNLFDQYIDNNEIEWTQLNNFSEGDIVYIYIAKPIQEIRYKCFVVDIDIKSDERLYDDSKYFLVPNYKNGNRFVRLKYVSEFKENTLTLDTLRKYGVKGNIQSAFKVKGELLTYLSRF